MGWKFRPEEGMDLSLCWLMTVVTRLFHANNFSSRFTPLYFYILLYMVFVIIVALIICAPEDTGGCNFRRNIFNSQFVHNVNSKGFIVKIDL